MFAYKVVPIRYSCHSVDSFSGYKVDYSTATVHATACILALLVWIARAGSLNK